MFLIVVDSILWTNVTRKMTPFEILTTLEGKKYEKFTQCKYISSIFFEKIGKFCVFFHHYICPIVIFWGAMLSSYGRKKDLRKCNI